jgi:hypothetical protein
MASLTGLAVRNQKLRSGIGIQTAPLPSVFCRKLKQTDWDRQFAQRAQDGGNSCGPYTVGGQHRRDGVTSPWMDMICCLARIRSRI